MAAIDRTMEIRLDTAAESERLGYELANLVTDRALVALTGPLGAGKTTFAKGAARALGVGEVVNSPTFTMLHEYSSGRMPLYHLDLYRLRENPAAVSSTSTAALSLIESELVELLSGRGLVLIEWADFFDQFISQQDHVLVELNYSTLPPLESLPVGQPPEVGRIARVSGRGVSASTIVEALANVYFS